MNFYRPTQLIENQKKLKKGETITKIDMPVPQNGKYYESNELNKAGQDAIVDKIIYPPKGGVLTYLKYYKYPYKGFPLEGVVHLMASLKGFLPVFAVFLKKLIKNPFAWITIKSAMTDAFPVFIEHSHKLLEPYFPEKYELYCQSVRELYRSFEAVGCSIHQTREEEKIVRRNPLFKELDTLIKLRNILCFILEFDNAYRYRFQDMFAELNKIEFEKNPVKELSRLFDILIEREPRKHMKNKWSSIKMLITFILKVDGRKREMVKKIIKSLNINEIKPQEDDWYFLNARTDYNFGGKIR